MNLLANSDFQTYAGFPSQGYEDVRLVKNGAVYAVRFVNCRVPTGWLAYTFDGAYNGSSYGQVEMGLGDTGERLWNSKPSVKYFKFSKRIKAGLLQTVHAPAGRYRLSAVCHGWSNHPIPGSEPGGPYASCRGNGLCSMGVGKGAYYAVASPNETETGEPWQDGVLNMTFRVGIALGRIDDPRSDAIQWGAGAHVYNVFHDLPAVEIAIPVEQDVTVFLDCTTRYPYENGNAYWGEATLTAIDDPVTPPTPPGADGAGKLGPHVQAPCAGIGDYLGAGVPVVKLVDAFGLVNQVAPGALVIGRRYTPLDAQALYQQGLTPTDAAVEFIGRQQSTYEANPTIIYWEGPNEPVWNTSEEMHWYGNFEIERMRLMEEQGRRCVIGNFATGTPPLTLWPDFVPACRFAREHGHILGLHEYSCPWMWWMTGKHQIDPTEDQGDEGWTTLRYRKVYRAYLIPHDAAPPLVITECGIDPLVIPKPAGMPAGAYRQLRSWWAGRGDPDYADQLLWYAGELAKDAYVVGATTFTWGSDKWPDFELAGSPEAAKLIAHARVHPAPAFEYERYLVGPSGPLDPPPAATCRPARVPYDRVYVLLHGTRDDVWFKHAAMGGYRERRTIGYSADDAGIGCGLGARTVIVVNPSDWADDIHGFFDAHYPGVARIDLAPRTPAELAVMLQSPHGGAGGLSQRDPRWASLDMGEEPGGETIGAQGCLLTSFTDIVRAASGRDVLPPLMNDILRQDGRPFTSDNYLTNWSEAVALFPTWFDRSLKYDWAASAAELRDLLAKGWLVVLRQAGGKHFVVLRDIAGEGSVRVMDPWYGAERTVSLSTFAGIRAARRVQPAPIPPTPVEPPQARVLYGMHDAAGGAWMRANGVRGVCLVHMPVRTAPVTVDFSELAAAGVTVLGRLSWGYADGSGTMPPPDQLTAHLSALAETMRNGKGVAYWHAWNEPNNLGEHPAGFTLTPGYLVDAYNRLRALLAGSGVKLGLTPVDPYFGPGSNNMDWWQTLVAQSSGADALFLHTGKTQTNDPGLIRSTARFSDDPLRWQYLNCLAMEPYLEAARARYGSLPVFLSECNPQFLTAIGGALGWKGDNAAWVHEFAAFISDWNRSGRQPVTGAVFYRYDLAGDQAPFGLADKPTMLQAIRAIAL